MASTNKTTNYELSQFIGTDKPTYLGDYNSDMLKIDTGMKGNADNITNVNTLATTAKNTADTAVANAGTALTNSVNAKNTADSALAKATANESKIDNFNLTSFDTITNFNKSGSGTIRTGSQVNVAMNSDGSLAKIYGQITLNGVTNTPSSQGTLSFATDLRPSEEITITGGGIGTATNTNGNVQTVYVYNYTIGTDGTVTMRYDNSNVNNAYVRIILINSLLFIKDFGDTPIE